MVTASKQEKKQNNKEYKEQDKQEVSLETANVGDTTA